MYAKKNSGMKIFAALLAVILLIGGTVGATIAWLQDTTETVTNTFTVGDIDIDLKEHELSADGKDLGTTEVTAETDYKILPGTSQPKDPFIKFTKDSEECWVFVKITENNNYTRAGVEYITWAIDTTEGWELISQDPEDAAASVTYIYGKKQSPAGDATLITTGTTINILADKTVSYNKDLTKSELNELGTTKPTLVFNGYAIQCEGLKDGTTDVMDATTAWTVANFQ